MNTKLSYPKNKLKILLLEGVSKSSVDVLKKNGYTNIKYLEKALDDKELIEAIKNVHFVGIRSRTQLTAKILKHAERLMAVGCFCIGTNQVDLEHCRKNGIPVFNAPHSNTRSVAELVLAEMIALYRGMVDKSVAAHKGEWLKSATNSFEVRGKTLGIVGYGHIGSQLSILAEALGLRVIYYDKITKLQMGNAKQIENFDTLLKESDFVSLHVPAEEDTVNLMNRQKIRKMKKGAILLNASRGNVVDIKALTEQLKSGKLLGAAIDVFPKEPASAKEKFTSTLQGLNNVILTPHIGGSTEEAQVNIGIEVANKLVSYSDSGSTTGAVNFPSISLPQLVKRHRLLHIHKNIPGVLSEINTILADSQTNILGQYLQTLPDTGYVVIDVDKENVSDLFTKLSKVEGTIKCRVLY
jgi:D-3-phosphoglycerate dehydrogenase / 2-oxoglutarate reductase